MQGEDCPDFVLKSDDDMYINLAALLEVVKDYQPEDRVLLGDLICGSKPYLNRASKYFVPDNQFAKTTYPPYLSTAYLMSRSTVMILQQAAHITPIFPMEDVFVTGILAGSSGIRPQDHPGFSYRHRQLEPCQVNRTVTTHRVRPREMVGVWREAKMAQKPGWRKLQKREEGCPSGKGWLPKNYLPGIC